MEEVLSTREYPSLMNLLDLQGYTMRQQCTESTDWIIW
jgi:hypothetical protein